MHMAARNWLKRSMGILFGCVAFLQAADLAANPPEGLRAQAVVYLSFDEASGPALDQAAQGASKDNAVLQNGAARLRSPFWEQSGKKALSLEAGQRQFVQIADSPDVDRADALTLAMLAVNLHPPGDGAFHGLFGKRQPPPNDHANYGINYAMAPDYLQFYLHDGQGFKLAQFGSRADTIGYRKPVFITVVMQAADAPAPDLDEDKDDLEFRLYINGKPIAPRAVVNGNQQGAAAWFTDVRLSTLTNDAPLVLGASYPNAEMTSCLIDEFCLFNKALTEVEIGQLFAEIAGKNPVLSFPDDAVPVNLGPELAALSQYGVTRGSTVVLALTGTNLLPEPKLVSTIPFQNVALRPGATPEKVEFEVTVPATQPTGHFPVRVATSAGTSGALTLAVDGLPQSVYAPTTADAPLKPPLALSGAISGQQQVKLHFAGAAGQRLVADLECRRLGSAMDPVLELKGPKGAPLAIAWGQSHLKGDARIETMLAQEGVYTLELHDLAYKAPGQNPFRLKLGDLKLVDATFPPAVEAGTQKWVSAIGTGMDPLAALPVDLQGAFPGLARSVTLTPETHAVAPAPAIFASEAVEIIEQPSSDGGMQSIDARFEARAHVPVVINGRIDRPGQVDRYLLQVKPGMTLAISAETSLIHSPLDAQVAAATASGQTLAVSEERPVIQAAAPPDASVMQLSIRDLNGRGSADRLYRLKIIPAGQPDFTLALGAARVTLPPAGNTVVRIDVNRAGYNGPVALSVLGAPEITVSPAEIPAGAVKSFAILSWPDGAPASEVSFKTLRIVGQSVGLDPPLRRVAMAPNDNRLTLVPDARTYLAASLGGQSGATLELSNLPANWFKGIDTALDVALNVANPGLKDKSVRLTLLTTEAPRNGPDPADPTRQRQIPLPLVHSVPEQTMAPGESSAALQLVMPTSIAEPAIECIVRADFVPNPFSDKVLASVYSKPLRIETKSAVDVQLASGNLNLQGNGQTRLAGSIKRAAGFNEPVVLSLLNLPAGYSATGVTVAPDQQQFELVITSPAVTAMSDIQNVQFRVATPAGALLALDRPIPTKVNP
jgi:hypothetical protein